VTGPSPSLAVIVPTYRRPGLAARLVHEVLAQALAGTEVVVVDQSPPAEAVAVADPRVVVLRRATPGLPAARNAGVAATTAPVVVFFDDDVTLAPGCLAAHLAAYTDPTIGGVAGRIREERLRTNAPPGTCRVDRGGRVRVHLDGDDPAEVATAKGAHMSFRRTALEDAGPFDEGYAGTAFLEDADLCTRVVEAGWRLVYVPGAAVTHAHHPEGGVRIGDPGETERWRFRNTGRFLARHRGPVALAPVLATFGAIAAVRALRWRRPATAVTLVSALLAGWWEGRLR
jgi:GT2 family glycosyltransferase